MWCNGSGAGWWFQIFLGVSVEEMSEAVGFLLFPLTWGVEVMVSYEDRLVGNTGDVIESEGSLECCLPAQKGPPPFLLFREAPS